jgi:hypothetical protein
MLAGMDHSQIQLVQSLLPAAASRVLEKLFAIAREDAELAAASAEITLTGREDGSNGRIPMAGVPFHSIEKYLIRLIQKGHKVALCDYSCRRTATVLSLVAKEHRLGSQSTRSSRR